MYTDMDLDGLKKAIMDMLAGKPCRINSCTFQNDVTTIRSKDDVLTLLVHLGYLAYDSLGKVVSIPNEEIREEFLNAVENGNFSIHTDLLIHAKIRNKFDYLRIGRV